MKNNSIDTWDYQWTFSQWKNNGFNIIPNVNLVQNIGFGENATHTTSESSKSLSIETKTISSLIHPNRKKINKLADSYTFYKIFEREKKQSYSHIVRSKIKRILIILHLWK